MTLTITKEMINKALELIKNNRHEWDIERADWWDSFTTEDGTLYDLNVFDHGDGLKGLSRYAVTFWGTLKNDDGFICTDPEQWTTFNLTELEEAR